MQHSELGVQAQVQVHIFPYASRAGHAVSYIFLKSLYSILSTNYMGEVDRHRKDQVRSLNKSSPMVEYIVPLDCKR